MAGAHDISTDERHETVNAVAHVVSGCRDLLVWQQG